MKISTKSRYGLRAIIYLAKTKGVCSIRKIGQAENISSDYLEKIMAKLEKAGLVRAKKGVQGGYFLTRSPEKITVGEIIRILEGTMAPVFCVAKGRGKKYLCPRKKICLTKDVWRKVQDVLNSTLDSITLANLIDKKI